MVGMNVDRQEGPSQPDSHTAVPNGGTREGTATLPSSPRHSKKISISSTLSARYTASVAGSDGQSIMAANGNGGAARHSALVRHHDLWFPDGSVVLRAENRLFRVHMSLLSRHSVFFRDLFSLPQPSSVTTPVSTGSHGVSANALAVGEKVEYQEDGLGIREELDGCPLIHLHDTAEDVKNLLSALYDGTNFSNNDRGDFRMIAGVLRLSTKYEVDSLRTKALAHLSVAWPLSLRGWDAREDIARDFELATNMFSGHRYPSPIAIINLAREVGAPELLPSAFYDLSRYTFSQIFEATDEDPLKPSDILSIPSTLSPDDLQKLTLGKEASHFTITSLIQSMGNSPHQQHHSNIHTGTSSRHSRARSCVSAAACRKDFSELVELATQHYLFDRERGCTDPLYVAEELGQLKSAEFSECKACSKALETWAAKERERIWKSIPHWFRLDMAHSDLE